MTQEHIHGFASELVRMATAMERLPEVERALESSAMRCLRLSETIQELELRLIDKEGRIDELQSAIKALEVSRDDAELRFLEADDAKATLVRVLDNLGKDILGALQAVQPLAGVKPTEDGELEGWQAVKAVAEVTTSPVDPITPPSAESSTTHDGIVESAKGLPDVPSSGESVMDPTSAPLATTESQSASSHGAETTTDVSSLDDDHGVYPRPFDPTPVAEPSPPDASSSADIVGDAEPIRGLYAGRRYRDVPGFITKADWLAGGGTEEDYLGTWWPSVSNASHQS